MIRLPRPRLSMATAAIGAPIVAGIATGAVAVSALLAQDWRVAAMAVIATAWATIATAWAHRAVSHTCPPAPAKEPVERGMQCVHFFGGPEDGGQALVPVPDRDLFRATLCIEGTDYDVTEIDRTCYRAELAPAEAGGDS